MRAGKLLRVLFLEPFDGGSHRAFARGWAAHSRHEITVETLPARFWKWRLRGAAFAFAERLARRARGRASNPSGAGYRGGAGGSALAHAGYRGGAGVSGLARAGSRADAGLSGLARAGSRAGAGGSTLARAGSRSTAGGSTLSGVGSRGSVPALARAGSSARAGGAAIQHAESRSAEGARAGEAGYDVIVATSLMNAADFMAAARITAPLIVYFHENQLSYPRPPDEPLDHGLALASLCSAAAADAVVFNSAYHRAAFFQGLKEWIGRFPELAPRRTAGAIRVRSSVIHPGIDWQALAPLALRDACPGLAAGALTNAEAGGRARGLTDVGAVLNARAARNASAVWSARAVDTARTAPARTAPARSGSGAPGDVESAPLILWNHRWEFDKNPDAFFAAMDALAARGWAFRLALLGENPQFVPEPFLAARARHGTRIAQFGYVTSAAAYRQWLGRADIVVSTARQENFGISIAEAIAAGAFPLVPARLSYPELLPRSHHAACLYRTQADLLGQLERLLRRPERIAEGRRRRSLLMRRYDWSRSAPALDGLVERVFRG